MKINFISLVSDARSIDSCFFTHLFRAHMFLYHCHQFIELLRGQHIMDLNFAAKNRIKSSAWAWFFAFKSSNLALSISGPLISPLASFTVSSHNLAIQSRRAINLSLIVSSFAFCTSSSLSSLAIFWTKCSACCPGVRLHPVTTNVPSIDNSVF